MKKKIISMFLGFVLAFCLTVGSISPAFAESSLNIQVNSETVTFPDAQPYIDIHNRTMVPIRFIAEAMGAEVSWNDAAKGADIYLNGVRISIGIDKYLYSIKNETDTYVGTMDTTPIIRNSRTFIPIRFVAEGLGANVNYVDATRTVEIEYQARNTQPVTGTDIPEEETNPSSFSFDSMNLRFYGNITEETSKAWALAKANVPTFIFKSFVENGWQFRVTDGRMSDVLLRDRVETGNNYTGDASNFVGMTIEHDKTVSVVDTVTISTIIHEFGHFFHAINHEYDSEIIECYEAEKEGFSAIRNKKASYYMSMPEEFFAQSFSYYFTDRKLVQLYFPKTFLLLQTMIGDAEIL